jgi:hypothetical protein
MQSKNSKDTIGYGLWIYQFIAQEKLLYAPTRGIHSRLAIKNGDARIG